MCVCAEKLVLEMTERRDKKPRRMSERKEEEKNGSHNKRKHEWKPDCVDKRGENRRKMEKKKKKLEKQERSRSQMQLKVHAS